MSEACIDTNSAVSYSNDKNGPESLSFLEPSCSNSRHQLCLYSWEATQTSFIVASVYETRINDSLQTSQDFSFVSLVLPGPNAPHVAYNCPTVLQHSTTKNSMFFHMFICLQFSLHTDCFVFLTFISCRQCTKSNIKCRTANKNRL